MWLFSIPYTIIKYAGSFVWGNIVSEIKNEAGTAVRKVVKEAMQEPLPEAGKKITIDALSVIKDCVEVSTKKALQDVIEDKKPWINTKMSDNPLEPYRNRRTFDVTKMQIFLESEDIFLYRRKVYAILERENALFKKGSTSLPVDDERRNATVRSNRIHDLDLFDESVMKTHPRRFMVTLGMLCMYDPNSMMKYVLAFHFFRSSITSLGTEKHRHLTEMIDSGQIKGCFALTEVAHGSNAKNLRTTVHFDTITQEFIIHTPDFEAAKCWVGNLGYSSTHATVYAQLITPDGCEQGLHGFVVPIRDPRTMMTYPGVTIGDMGEKAGLNGVDNGFAVFNNYRIPKDALLDKNGTVLPDGRYHSIIKDPRKRFGSSLGSLISGRVCVVYMSMGNLHKAISIAVRYSAARKQFGPAGKEELSVIEYELQQWRLFPHIAAAYALSLLASSASEMFVKLNMSESTEGDEKDLKDYGIEVHGLMSVTKPITSWAAQECIQEAREACGGHGYLSCSGFGQLRNDNDVNCTYEGDNNVLMQQTSNWLMSLWVKKGMERFSSPLGSVTFLYDTQPASPPSALGTVPDLQDILSLYEWLIRWLLDQTESAFKNRLSLGDDYFTAKNKCQVFLARSLALSYGEHYVLLMAKRKIASAEDNAETRVFTRLMLLYGLTRLQTHIGDLYEGGAAGPALPRSIKAAILELCRLLKDDAVSLVDAIAPPDFVLNSAIGKADGEIYKNLRKAFMDNPDVTKRPDWWQELTKRRSKL